MKKWLVFVLGVITGLLIARGLPSHGDKSDDSGIEGLEMFDQPHPFNDFSEYKIEKLRSDGCALAEAEWPIGPAVLIIPGEGQEFYDEQKIKVGKNQIVQRVGTYKERRLFRERTMPAIRIMNRADSPEAGKAKGGITLFDKPGECVSRKNFEVQRVLESGDAIAEEIRDAFDDYVFTSGLEVLFLAKDGQSYFNKQVIKVPKGKCARQIGTYKYQIYDLHVYVPENDKTIPIVEIMK